MAGKRITRGVGKIASYLVAGAVVGIVILLAVAYYASPVTAPMVHDPLSAEDVIPAP